MALAGILLTVRVVAKQQVVDRPRTQRKDDLCQLPLQAGGHPHSTSGSTSGRSGWRCCGCRCRGTGLTDSHRIPHVLRRERRWITSVSARAPRPRWTRIFALLPLAVYAHAVAVAVAAGARNSLPLGVGVGVRRSCAVRGAALQINVDSLREPWQQFCARRTVAEPFR